MKLSCADLDAFVRLADPLADDTAAAIIGPWQADALADWSERMARIGAANRLIAQWSSNGALLNWPLTSGGGDTAIVAVLRRYVAEAGALPEWADSAKIIRAEQLFMEYGPLSCALLFCASLPECYFLPDLAEVLHITGQMERNTEHRVRSTAAMVFPVMTPGGLTTSAGNGVAQILKVRLIHAMIRNLILRGNPSQTTEPVSARPAAPTDAAANGGAHRIYEALSRHGWDVSQQGQPCSQLQLAYTLLTFSYVFLRAMRTLRLPVSAADEEAVLHAWNVSAHILGVRRELMVDTMDEARDLFERMQVQYGSVRHGAVDARSALGCSLMDSMAAAIKWPVARALPIPMSRFLCRKATARAIGLNSRSTPLADVMLRAALGAAWMIDAVARLVFRQFSTTRLLARLVQEHVISAPLMSQTRPLRLPGSPGMPLRAARRAHSVSADAPTWIGRIEHWLTSRRTWGGEPRP